MLLFFRTSFLKCFSFRRPSICILFIDSPNSCFETGVKNPKEEELKHHVLCLCQVSGAFDHEGARSNGQNGQYPLVSVNICKYPKTRLMLSSHKHTRAHTRQQHRHKHTNTHAHTWKRLGWHSVSTPSASEYLQLQMPVQVLRNFKFVLPNACFVLRARMCVSVRVLVCMRVFRFKWCTSRSAFAMTAAGGKAPLSGLYQVCRLLFCYFLFKRAHSLA